MEHGPDLAVRRLDRANPVMQGQGREALQHLLAQPQSTAQHHIG